LGDPKKTRRKYITPKHPWRLDRIEGERALAKKYGLKNRREIWKMETVLRKYRRQARRLLALKTEQAKIEEKRLLDRLQRLNLLKKGSTLDDVLALTIDDIMERRLESLVFKKGLANTHKQARQFIVHGHISVGGKKITSPSHLVSSEEEKKITFSDHSRIKVAAKGKEA
jgi:small subunit ribosomal protein S4